MNYRPWTEEEKAEVRRGIAAGLSYRAIGIALGRHNSSVRDVCLRYGLLSDYAYSWTEEQIAEVRQRVAAGEPYIGIAAAIGRDRKTVKDFCVKHGLRPPIPPCRPWTKEEIIEVRRRMKNGERVKDACAAIGRRACTVRELSNRAAYLSTFDTPKPKPKPAPKPKASISKPMPDFDKEHAQWMKEARVLRERRLARCSI